LDIWVPAAAGLAHRVRDVIAKTRALATDVAVRCHDGSFKFRYGEIPVRISVLSGEDYRPTRLKGESRAALLAE